MAKKYVLSKVLISWYSYFTGICRIILSSKSSYKQRYLRTKRQFLDLLYIPLRKSGEIIEKVYNLNIEHARFEFYKLILLV